MRRERAEARYRPTPKRGLWLDSTLQRQLMRQDPKKLYVCRTKCDECLFTEERIVPKSRAAELIEDCQAEDRHFLCHKAQLLGLKVPLTCRGSFELNPRNVRFARAHGIEIVETTAEELARDA